MVNSSVDAALAMLVVAGLVAVGGYLAGSTAYYISQHYSRGRKLKAPTIVSLACIGAALVYYSFGLFLPFLLLAAHQAWWHHTIKRLRREKLHSAWRGICTLSRRHPPANSIVSRERTL